MAQCLYRALYRTPGTTIDVISPPAFGPLLAMMPQVNECIPSPFRRGRMELAARCRLGRRLSERGYGRAIVLPNSWKSALPIWVAGIPVRTGYVGEQRWGLINDARRLDRSALPMTAQRFAALAGEQADAAPDLRSLRPALEVSDEAAGATASALGLGDDFRRVLVLCPGAEYGPSKQWPAANFAEVALSMLDRDWQVWLLGSDKDTEIAGEITTRCGERCQDLTGRTSIEQAVHLMALGSAVVSNDSGLMHIAAALEKPLVALYGSTDPRHTPPLSRNHSIEYLGLSCSPCFERHCPLEHLDCLTGIAPTRVLDAIEALCGS